MAKKVIALLGQPIYNEDVKAAEAIMPGHLVNYDGSGNLVKHADADAAAARTFALERDELGNGIDVAYATGDAVKVGSFHQGQRVYAFIASGVNAAKGTLLESKGDGTLETGSGVKLARAVEAVNNSAGPGAARCTVEIL